ncbi:hypothetical protein [Ulvibacterium sp.]
MENETEQKILAAAKTIFVQKRLSNITHEFNGLSCCTNPFMVSKDKK